MKNNRLLVIDYLRALAIVIMILTHSLVPYLNNKNIFFFWNITHFAVPIFVFCSAYLFFRKYLKQENFNPLIYIKKRLVQLLSTYYVYALIYFFILKITRAPFFNFKFIKNSLLINGGIDINWLVLLFIFFAFLFPLLRLLIINYSLLFILYSLFSLGSTIYLLFPNYSLHPTPYKLIMWLPWSLIVIYSYFFHKYKSSKKFIFGAIIYGVVLFIISYIIRSSQHLSLGRFNNKYPPNLYYLSYGFVILNFLYLIFSQLTISNLAINNFLFFTSSNSYSLFFIHYLVIYVLRYFSVDQSTNWSFFFIIVTIISFLVQYLVNNIKIFTFRFIDKSK